MKRPHSTEDIGFAYGHICGAVTESYAHDRQDLQHQAECCDCQLMQAWWAHRLPPRRGQLELDLGSMAG